MTPDKAIGGEILLKLTEKEAEIRRLEQRIAELEESSVGALLEFRGIEKPCKKCSGAGSRVYADTSTWHSGIGGQMLTTGVCDHCWGSGDELNIWPSHRKYQNMQNRVAELEAAWQEEHALRITLEERLSNLQKNHESLMHMYKNEEPEL
jgi:hypothetical protein